MQRIIRITDEHLIVNSKIINWKDIVGIRAFSSAGLRHLGTRFPFAELFIKGGKSLSIRAEIVLEGIAVKKYDDQYKNKYRSFYTLMEIISERAVNRKNDISNWIEWRIVVPIFCAEVIAGLHGIFTHKSFDEIIMIGLISGIVATPFGFLWEHKARNKKWT